MLYLPISKAWIVSRVARRLYLASALAAMALFGVEMASLAALRASGVDTLSPSSAGVVRVLLWPGIAGTALLTVAMWYFWFTFDSSSWVKKTLWFLPLYCMLPIGPAFYYFFVYRRSPMIRGLDQVG